MDQHFGSPCDGCDDKFWKASRMIHKSEVDEVNKGTAELWLYKADSLAMLTHSVGASSAVSLLSALTHNTVYVCGTAAGGNEQSAEDHLARRRDRETTGLPDVHSIKGRVPSLCCCDVTFMSGLFISLRTELSSFTCVRQCAYIFLSEGSEVNLSS